MPLLKKRTIIGVKQESTPGTPETLTGDDALYAKNVKIDPEFMFNAREDDATLGKRTGVIGSQKAKCSFEIEVKGSGTNGVSPNYALELFPSCALKETDDGIWNPTSLVADQKPVTVGVYEDGLLKKIAGACGEVKYVAEAGKIPVWRFEMEGLWVPPTDAAMIEAEPDTIKPVPFKAVDLSLDSYLAPVSKLEIGFGNKVVCREDPENDSGYTFACVVDRDITGKLDPESVLVATYDVFGRFKAGAESAFEVVQGSTPGNIVTISGTKAQYKNVGSGERNQIGTHEVDFNFNRTDGDDEITISFVSGS